MKPCTFADRSGQLIALGGVLACGTRVKEAGVGDALGNTDEIVPGVIDPDGLG
jgi:hypothetical protein